MRNVLGLMLLSVVLKQGDAETRVIHYLKASVNRGQPVMIADLLTKVFRRPEEQQAVQHVFNIMFQVPMAIVDDYKRTQTLPTLQRLSDEFELKVPGEMDVLLRILGSDPRIPKFFDRDPGSGEITRVMSLRFSLTQFSDQFQN